MMIEMYAPVLTSFYNVNRNTTVFKIGKAGSKAYVLFDREHMEELQRLISEALEKDK